MFYFKTNASARASARAPAMSHASSSRKRQALHLQEAVCIPPTAEPEMLDESIVEPAHQKRLKRSTAPSKSTKRKKKQVSDDDTSSNTDQAEKRRKKRDLNISRINEEFQDAVREGRMSEAFDLLDRGRKTITSVSLAHAAMVLSRSEKVNDLKQISEKIGARFANILVDSQLRVAIAAKTNLPVVKTVLAAIPWKYKEEWKRMIFGSNWIRLWIHLLDTYTPVIPLPAVPGTITRSLTLNDWGLLIDNGLCVKENAVEFWKNFINTPNERSSLELLKAKRCLPHDAFWYSAAMACNDVGIIRFLKNLGVPITFWSVHSALSVEKIDFAEAMIECGVETRSLRSLLYEFSRENNEKPASVRFLVSKGLKLTRTEMKDLFESPSLAGARLALDQGGNPMDFNMSAWRKAIKANWIGHLQLYVDYWIDLNADKGYALFFACYHDDVSLLKKLLGWGYSVIPEALEYAHNSRKSLELSDALNRAFKKIEVGGDDAGALPIEAFQSLSLTRMKPDLKMEDAYHQPIPSIFETRFASTPAFFTMLGMLNTWSVRNLRQTCRYFRAVIPNHFHLREDQIWDNLARGVEMDYGLIITYKHRIGSIKHPNRTVNYTWRRYHGNTELLYNVAVLLGDKSLLRLILKKMASTNQDTFIEPSLLVLLAISSLLTLKEAASLLQTFSVSTHGSLTIQDRPCTVANFLTYYRLGPLDALTYMFPFIDKDFTLMIDAAAYFGKIDYISHIKMLSPKLTSSMMNCAACIAAERGNEGMVNALIRWSRSQRYPARISEKVVLSGRWSIVITMLKNGFKFHSSVFEKA
ncbi:hypothetical protein HDU67_000121 [Dinochytrium kinnereticum]|nr:hypothetical protein HDU67_000121 [Dinochytrium kinnereticum]